MSTSTADRLVMMANQIALNLAAQGEERAVPQIADHIVLFWDPRMKAAIASHVEDGGAGLSDLALKGVKQALAKV